MKKLNVLIVGVNADIGFNICKFYLNNNVNIVGLYRNKKPDISKLINKKKTSINKM